VTRVSNLTFKRYIESSVTLLVKDDYVTAVEGEGLALGTCRTAATVPVSETALRQGGASSAERLK
jgi:hypothetical protein